MTEPWLDSARLGRAAAALRERGEGQHEAGQRDAERPEAAAHASPEYGRAAFYRARRGYLRRLSTAVGEGGLDGYAAELQRAPGATAAAGTPGCRAPGVHRFRHAPLRCAPVLPAAWEAQRAVLACLELVAGIGPVTARRLRAGGVEHVGELLRFEVFADDAARVLDDWERHDLSAICARLTRRLGGRGHLLSALLCATVAPEDIAFLDLETMGLWNNTVFLAGVGRLADDGLSVHQYLAPSHADEPAVIACALAQLADAKMVVTFNGRSADLPWLAGRAFYYGLGPVPKVAHVDLLYGTRRRYQHDEERLASARLPEVSDELLQLARPTTDVPSWMVPEVYAHYTRDPARREALLLPLLEHNRADLEALVHLLSLLCAEAAPGALAPAAGAPS